MVCVSFISLHFILQRMEDTAWISSLPMASLRPWSEAESVNVLDISTVPAIVIALYGVNGDVFGVGLYAVSNNLADLFVQNETCAALEGDEIPF
jgi:hypothetical protein